MEAREGDVAEGDAGFDDPAERETPLIPLAVVTEMARCEEEPSTLDLDVRALLASKPGAKAAVSRAETPPARDESARVTPVVAPPLSAAARVDATPPVTKIATPPRGQDRAEPPAEMVPVTGERTRALRHTASLPPARRSRALDVFVVVASAAIGALATFAMLTWTRPAASHGRAVAPRAVLAPLAVPNVSVEIQRPAAVQPSVPAPVNVVVEPHRSSHHHHHDATRAGVEPFRPGFEP